MTDTDLKLARRARRGDREALEALYDRYRGRLLGYLDRLLGNRAVAEDVFQDVWIKVMRGLRTYRPVPGSFRPWLFRIAANAAVDRRRRDSRRAGLALDAPAGEESAERLIDQVAADIPTPEAAGIGSAIGRDLQVALQQLPERQRSATLLRHQQGMSYGEISATLQIPEGTAKTLVHRGTRALRVSLARWSNP